MIIIPARIGSTRYPKKILADIGGEPMVVKTAKAVAGVDRVAVATDSGEVVDICGKHGIEAVMTSPNHQSGTDRLDEAATSLGLAQNEIIINVQGDEPFIEAEVVQAVRDLTKSHAHNDQILLNSAYKAISGHKADDPDTVKVVTNASGHALYFSRSRLPYPREAYDAYKGHLGIYGYTRKALGIFCSLKPAPLEQVEKLEQLRALHHGYKIAMTEVQTQSFGIDTPADLEEAKKVYGF